MRHMEAPFAARLASSFAATESSFSAFFGASVENDSVADCTVQPRTGLHLRCKVVQFTTSQYRCLPTLTSCEMVCANEIQG